MTPTPFVARIAGESERMKTYRKGILSTALWILSTVTSHAQTTFTIVDLGALSGGDVSQATGINNSGRVVGWSSSPSGLRAFLWSSGSGMLDLGTLSGDAESVANGIN